MAIRFRLPAEAAERAAFACSPLLELVLSLHVLVEPKHHPLQQPWVRQMRALPAPLRREIGAFAFTYRSYFPGFLLPEPAGANPTLEEELARLEQLPDQAIRAGFTQHLDAGAPLPPGPGGQALEQLARHQPRRFLARFAGMVGEYWQQAFQAEWDRLEPQLSATISQAGQVIAGEGLYRFLSAFVGEVRIDRHAGVFWLDRDHHHEVTIGAEDMLVLVPSIYVWPHVRVNCDAPGPLALVFPAQSLTRAAQPPLPPGDLLAILKALASDTRLRALQMIAERPRTTQELAPLLNLTEAAASAHLHALTRAGLLRARRDGYYVLYRLDPDRLHALTSTLPGYIYGPQPSAAVPPADTP
jgi:DNA-binding transcriptional ArsR family regulator